VKNIKYRLLSLVFLFAVNASAQTTLELQDYAALPITGLVDGKTNYDALLARVSGFREEPGGANRLFVADLNGPLYVVDKNTKKSSVYLDFNGREGKRGIFHKLFYESGYGSGLNTLYFDPDYRKSGLSKKRKVLHGSHRGSGAAGLQHARQREFSWLQHRGLHDDFGNTHAWSDTLRRRPYRMDGHEYIECDLRRNSPRIAAHSIQHPYSPSRRPYLQSGGPVW
jgi:hypothetical protein